MSTLSRKCTYFIWGEFLQQLEKTVISFFLFLSTVTVFFPVSHLFQWTSKTLKGSQRMTQWTNANVINQNKDMVSKM